MPYGAYRFESCRGHNETAVQRGKLDHRGLRPCFSRGPHTPEVGMEMSNRLRAGLLLSCAMLAACSAGPEPVPVAGAPMELVALAGEWSGYYNSPAVGRTGSIVFELEAGRDTAYGDVTMIPRGWTRPLRPMDDPAADARDAPAPRVLKIAFVRVEGTKVTGTMEPYKDPDCNCAVNTTFTANLKEDVIEGKILSRMAIGPRFEGSWRVQRN